MFALWLVLIGLVCDAVGGTVLTLSISRSEVYNSTYANIYVNSTAALVTLLGNGTVRHLCSWCPPAENMTTELTFLRNQTAYIDKLRDLYNATLTKRNTVLSYTLFLQHNVVKYNIEHSVAWCYVRYASWYDEPHKENCSSPLQFNVTGAHFDRLLEDGMEIYARWTKVMHTIIHKQRIENVNVSFYRYNENKTLCLVECEVPVDMKVELYGPNLNMVSTGFRVSPNGGLQTGAYNDTYPDVTCRVTSPTGWIGIIRNVTNEAEIRHLEPVKRTKRKSPTNLRECLDYNIYVSWICTISGLLMSSYTLYSKRRLLNILWYPPNDLS